MNSYERIQNAIDFIEANLTNPVKLEQVAAAGFFSLSHFYRIFHALVGRPVKEYIRLRRLSEAAIRLINTDDKLIDICFDYQFEYQESFTRAFRAAFDITPGQYRKRGLLTHTCESLNLTNKYFASDEANMIDPGIKVLRYLEPMRVAYYRAMSRTPELDAWNKLHAWAEKNGLLQSSKPYRIFGFDNPGPSKTRSTYGYELWFTVELDTKGSEEIGIKEFPGGLYAVTGTTVAQIGDAWKHFVRWLKISKYRQGNHQCFEEILSPIGTEEDEIKIDLYLPIAKN